MIRVDPRSGSGELTPYFEPYGLVVEKTHLDYGDFDFEGSGPKGRCGVVFERKRIEDLIDSMQTGRLSGHQLPGICESYDYGYLLIEGIWRPGKDGLLEISGRYGNWTTRNTHTRSISNFVMGLAFRAGLMPWRTGTPAETVSFIVDQYRMWEAEWSSHKAHETVYAPAEATGSFGLMLRKREITIAEKVAMQLPGLNEKAKYVAQHFGSVRRMAAAGVDEWAELNWYTRSGKRRKLGLESARTIVGAICTG